MSKGANKLNRVELKSALRVCVFYLGGAAMAFEPDEKFDFLFKVVLIGDAGIGKTCIVQRFKSGNYVERQGSTIGVDFTMKTLVIDKKRIKVRILLVSNTAE